jgi:REP element-mobilizing transposase RayT
VVPASGGTRLDRRDRHKIHYVLMQNHYHLIIETPEGNLSKVMQYIDGSYTKFVNRRKGRGGHLFQGRYKAILMVADTYLLQLSQYVHLNPVRPELFHNLRHIRTAATSRSSPRKGKRL